ncbi:hypothetical protein OH76DRAFT_939133 [Lentinus brumalis]|uniref:Uncharacterized protein n=1 Tax=Lentinus brumalis TaxID=2498619 RepID=A0A371CZF1_9APHY|nr:hypothetical protein OH76DRAFT_939133 [Polyporus brumalis]
MDTHHPPGTPHILCSALTDKLLTPADALHRSSSRLPEGRTRRNASNERALLPSPVARRPQRQFSTSSTSIPDIVVNMLLWFWSTICPTASTLTTVKRPATFRVLSAACP